MERNNLDPKKMFGEEVSSDDSIDLDSGTTIKPIEFPINTVKTAARTRRRRSEIGSDDSVSSNVSSDADISAMLDNITISEIQNRKKIYVCRAHTIRSKPSPIDPDMPELDQISIQMNSASGAVSRATSAIITSTPVSSIGNSINSDVPSTPVGDIEGLVLPSKRRRLGS